MPSASHIAHRGLPFANPIREADVDRALAALRLPPGALVLDTGCGSGEMLLRALARDPSWRGGSASTSTPTRSSRRTGARPRASRAATCASRCATRPRSTAATTPS